MAFTAATLGLAGAAIKAVGGIIDTAVRALTAAWAKAWDLLAGRFAAAVEALLVGAEGGWPSRSRIDNDPALRTAMAAAARALNWLTGLTRTEAGDAVRGVVGRAASDQAGMIASQLPPGHDPTRVAGATGRPGGFHARAVAAIEARARKRITALTRPLTADADAAMRRNLVRGVRVGANPRETAGRMVKQVEGAFNGGLTRALTIARTETLDSYRQAAAAAQDANKDLLAGWTWHAKLDERTCPACWAMHGAEHPLTESGPQGHQQCRCSRAPRTMSWRDLGFDLDEPASVIPDAETAFAALPRDQQLRIMGAARLALLDSGAIAWRHLARRRDNPGWRPSYVPVPVKDLTPAGA